MDPVITQGPNLYNPNTLGEQELRNEVFRLHREVMSMAAGLHRSTVVANALADEVKCLVDAFERGDQEAINTKLQTLLNWRKAQEAARVQH